MSGWVVHVCPNYCVFGSYGGGENWKMMKPHLEDDWNFCPVCGAKAIVFVNDYSVRHQAFEKEQRRRFLYWKRHGKHNFNLATTLPPIPEKKRLRPNAKAIKALENDGFRQALESRNSARRNLQTKVVQGVAPEYKNSLSAARHDVHVEIYPGKHPRPSIIHSRTVSDILVKAFLIRALQLRFRAGNPDVGTDLVDWTSYVPARSTFSEGLEVMKEAYPHYEWGRER